MSLCACGCGRETPINKRNRYDRGEIKGEHRRFIRGHALRGRLHEPLADRFWAKVDRGGPDECWEWQASRQKRRGAEYGLFRFGERAQGAHRVAWELTNGPIPPGVLVLHTCDNPPCCNPAHLFVGSHADNRRDSRAKGRDRASRNRGEAHPGAKLKEADVADMRARRDASASLRSLSERFGVAIPTVSGIINGKSWKPDPPGAQVASPR